MKQRESSGYAEMKKAARDWIIEFHKEVDRVNEFYLQMLDDYINQFVRMQAKYL